MILNKPYKIGSLEVSLIEKMRSYIFQIWSSGLCQKLCTCGLKSPNFLDAEEQRLRERGDNFQNDSFSFSYSLRMCTHLYSDDSISLASLFRYLGALTDGFGKHEYRSDLRTCQISIVVG
jgi:hypothetical protein